MIKSINNNKIVNEIIVEFYKKLMPLFEKLGFYFNIWQSRFYKKHNRLIFIVEFYFVLEKNIVIIEKIDYYVADRRGNVMVRDIYNNYYLGFEGEYRNKISELGINHSIFSNIQLIKVTNEISVLINREIKPFFEIFYSEK